MIKKFQQFGSDVKYEMSKVSWPDWDSLKGSTYVVLVLSFILTLFEITRSPSELEYSAFSAYN